MLVDHGAYSMYLLVITLGALLAFYYWRRTQSRRLTRIFEARNLELQQFLNERTESLKRLLEDPVISVAELKGRTDTIVAEMEARNCNGNIDAFLADTKEYLARKIGKIPIG